MLGDCAFICAAPNKLWNSRPVSFQKAETLLTFKNLLKTYFFAHTFRLISMVFRVKDLQIKQELLECAQ